MAKKKEMGMNTKMDNPKLSTKACSPSCGGPVWSPSGHSDFKQTGPKGKK